MKGENMEKSLFPTRTFEVTFSGVDVLGVPKGKGMFSERIMLNNGEDENEAIKRAKENHPDLPENVRITVEELPTNDPFFDDRR